MNLFSGSQNKEIREKLHQIQNYNLVQLEILKKETICRMIQILQSSTNKYSQQFLILAQKGKRFKDIPYLKIFAYRLGKQNRMLQILAKFQKNRELHLNYEMKRQEAISKLIQCIQNTKHSCFYKWKTINNQISEHQLESTQARNNRLLEFSVSLLTNFTKYKFKTISSAFIVLKQIRQKQESIKNKCYLLKIKLKKIIKNNLINGFIAIKTTQKNSQNFNIDSDVIRNLSTVSNRLSLILKAANQKYLRKRRNLIIYKYLCQIENEERQIFNNKFNNWKNNLCQFNFNNRIKITDQSQQLEDDQKLLIQQYQQLNNENSELQIAYQQVQTYFHTPTGLSIKKSDSKILQQNQQTQRITQLNSSFHQEIPNQGEEECIQKEELQIYQNYVVNIEFQIQEYTEKLTELQTKRKMYLEEHQAKKDELLKKLALKKKQNIEVN